MTPSIKKLWRKHNIQVGPDSVLKTIGHTTANFSTSDQNKNQTQDLSDKGTTQQ